MSLNVDSCASLRLTFAEGGPTPLVASLSRSQLKEHLSSLVPPEARGHLVKAYFESKGKRTVFMLLDSTEDGVFNAFQTSLSQLGQCAKLDQERHAQQMVQDARFKQRMEADAQGLLPATVAESFATKAFAMLEGASGKQKRKAGLMAIEMVGTAQRAAAKARRNLNESVMDIKEDEEED